MASSINLYEQPAKLSLTGNPIAFQWRVNNSDNLSMFRLAVVVMLWNGSEYEELQPDAVYPDTDGMVTLNVQGLLQNRIQGKFTYPESKYNTIIEHLDLCGKFKIKYYATGFDASNNTVNEDPVTLADEFYFLEGGQPDEVLQLQTMIVSDFYSELVADKKFLTHQPVEKSIHPEQCEKLYWLVREGCTALKVNLQVDYLNGSTDTITGESVSVTAFNICEITATLKYLVDDPYLVASYKIWLTDQAGSTVSEVREYTLDHQWHERNDFLLFKNSLGTYDTLWMNGERSNEISGEREFYNTQLPNIRPRLSDRQFLSTRALMARKHESNTGWISKEYADYLQELMHSEDVVYLYGDQALQVKHLTEEITPQDDSKDLSSLDIEWQLGVASRFYGNFNKEIKCPLPPYWNDVEACFVPVRGKWMIDIKGGKRAEFISVETVGFPTLTNDVFNRGNVDYWLNDIPIYAHTHHWKLDEITGTFTIQYSTQLCREVLFFKDIDGKLHTTAPIIVYKSERTAEQQNVIVKYMNEYFFIAEDGLLVKDKEEFVTEKL